MRALVIDDSRAIRTILTRTLNDLGYEVCTAANGLEALAVLESQGESIDVALVDWNMPEMDGLSFVEAVRDRGGWPSLKMMMVTTETELARVVRALEAGAHEFVMKPFTPEVIASKLALLGLSSDAA
jgi:two-component system, chemotaxis family, chemotaxis protein CheY